MYEQHWGFTEVPFRPEAGPLWLHPSAVHAETLSRMEFLVEDGRRCGLLEGPPGTGRTLLLKALLAETRRSQRRDIYVDLDGLTEVDLTSELALRLHLPVHDSSPRHAVWRSLRGALTLPPESTTPLVLACDNVDRADSTAVGAVVRLLNLPDHGRANWTLLATAESWSGSPLCEFAELRMQVRAWNARETAEYIAACLERTGRAEPIFDDSALETLQRLSGGIPRKINRLCDLALLAGMGDGLETIDGETVSAAAGELLPRRVRSNELSPQLA